MNLEKLIRFTILTFIFILLFKGCIKQDIKLDKPQEQSSQKSLSLKVEPKKYSNKTIDGVDYLMAPSDEGKFGGTLYTSTIGEGPKTFNPWNSKDATSSELAGMLFDGLVATDAYTGEIRPQLAKNFSISPDGKTYTFNLRKGVKWSDCKDLTADDVVYTWNEIILKGLGNTSVRDSVLINGQYPQALKIDKYTMKFVLPSSFAPFERVLSFNIAPKHIFKPVTDKGAQAFNAFYSTSTPPEKFVTSGMFKLKKYIPAQRVVMKRNPNYYVINKQCQKLPYLDEYVVYIVGDLNNQVLKFEAGEIDELSIQGKNAARYKQLEKNSDYKIYNLGPDTGTMFIFFNLNTRKNKDGEFYVEPKKQKWFNDLNFRSAIDYAIDRESLVSNILNGVGSELFTAESLPSLFLNKKLAKGHPRDIKKAKEFLKKSGYFLDKENRLRDKDNNLVEFTLLTNAGNTEREAVGVMIKEDLEQLGIKVNFKPIEFNTLVGKISDSFDWDVAIIGLTGNTLEPHNGSNVWKSNGALHLFNMRKGNDINKNILPWEKELDKIFDEGAKEIDFEKRKVIYNRYQQIVYDQKPMIYLYSPLRIIAIRKKFGNIHPTSIGGVLHNLEEVYIK